MTLRRMNAALGMFGTAVALFISITPVSGHHVPAAKFDPAKPITLKGTVSKVDWLNPHVHVFLEVKDAKGARAGRSNWRARSISGETAGPRTP